MLLGEAKVGSLHLILALESDTSKSLILSESCCIPVDLSLNSYTVLTCMSCLYLLLCRFIMEKGHSCVFIWKVGSLRFMRTEDFTSSIITFVGQTALYSFSRSVSLCYDEPDMQKLNAIQQFVVLHDPDGNLEGSMAN